MLTPSALNPQPTTLHLLWEPVPRAFDDPDELWQRVDKVDKLGYEEEQQGFAKVAKNPDHGKRHSRKIRVRVAHENLSQFWVLGLWVSGGSWMQCGLSSGLAR
jgi:hypothetical protein